MSGPEIHYQTEQLWQAQCYAAVQAQRMAPMFDKLTRQEVTALYEILTRAADDNYKAVRFAIWLRPDDSRYDSLYATWREVVDLRVSAAEAASRVHHAWLSSPI